MKSGLLARKLSKTFTSFQRRKKGSKMRPVSYLHIGLPKTGFSAIYEEDNNKLTERYPVCDGFCRIAEPYLLRVSGASPFSPEEQVELLLERLLPAYVAAGE